MYTTRTLRSLMMVGVLGFAIAAGGCGSDGSTTTAPLTGTLTGSFGGDACGDAGSEVAVFIDATGELSGVGPVTLHIDETAICGEQGLDGITDVTGTYTTDNGDELRFTGTGSTMSFDGDTATASYTATDKFDGGTGGFADATGQESVTFSHNFTDMVLTVVVDGELTTTD